MKTSSKAAADDTRPAFIKFSDEACIIKQVEYGYDVYVAEKKEGDKYMNYYIPSFNIYYFAANDEDSKRIGDAAMTSFFNYWVKNQGKKAFLDEIKRLGFKESKAGTAKLRRGVRFSHLRDGIPSAFNKRPYTIQRGRIVA